MQLGWRQTVLNVSGLLLKETWMISILQISYPYVAPEDHVGRFQVMSNKINGFATIEQETSLAGDQPDKIEPVWLNGVEWRWSVRKDEAYKFIAYRVFDHTRNFVIEPAFPDYEELAEIGAVSATRF